jgi:glutamate/tyrosine decarboxylase-like PLP-dependent enzyme
LGCSGLSRFVLFTSEECHYSIHKFASFIGIGEDNVILISTDNIGQIVPEDLEEKIKKEIAEGTVPLAVIATLGKLS